MSRRAASIEELARTPSPESWRLLCEALAKLPEREALRRIASIEPNLDRWDPKLRSTMCGMDWDTRFFAGDPDPRSSIVRFLRFDRIFFGRHGGMRMRRPDLGAVEMANLASSSGVRRLTRMDFSYHPLRAAGVRALAQGRHFTGLTELRLSSCDLDAEALEHLARAPFFPGLKELSISSNRLGAAALAPLIVDRDIALRSLDAGSNALGADGARVLAGARVPSLVEIDLSRCELGLEGARALSTHSGTVLERLNVSSNGLGDEGLRALVSGSLQVRALHLSGDTINKAGLSALVDAQWPLRSLRLSDNAIGDDAVRAIVEARLEGLEELDIEDNDVTGAGLAALLASDRPALRTLNVTGNRVGASALHHLGRTIRTVETLLLGENRVEDDGVRYLAGASAEALRSLSLVRNGVTPRALEMLSGAPWFGSLTSLDLSHNPLGPAAGLVLGARPLVSLTLSSSGLGDEGLLALSAADFRPKCLALADCNLGDRGIEALADSPILTNVETLALGRNRITDRGIRALIRAPHAKKLEVLHLDGNRIGDEGAIALAGWEGPLAFHVGGNPIGERGRNALAALPARCCP